MRLALNLGMTLEDLMTMSHEEYLHWVAFYRIESGHKPEMEETEIEQAILAMKGKFHADR